MTEELTFCKTCEWRRVRDVKEDLQRLFHEKTLEPNTCAICSKHLNWCELDSKNPSQDERRSEAKNTHQKEPADARSFSIKREPITGHGEDDKDDASDDADFMPFEAEEEEEEEGSSIENENGKEKKHTKLVIRFSPAKPSSVKTRQERREARKSANVKRKRERRKDGESSKDDIDDEVKELMQMEETLDSAASDIMVNFDDDKQEKDKFDPIKFVDPTLLNYLNLHNQSKSFECIKCSEEFQHLATFANHVSNHTETLPMEKPYRCIRCEENFTASGYYVHQISHKNATRKIRCLYLKCKYTFHKHCTLKSHLEVHKGLRHHLCKICGGGFYNKRELVVHAELHLEDKPFTCGHCDKTFSSERSCKVHEQHVHEKRNRYSCDECNNFTCPTPSRLLTHKKTHRVKGSQGDADEVSEQCQEELDIKDYIHLVHERLIALMDKPRRKDKPYKCKFCVTNEFRSAPKLLEHIKEKHEEVDLPITVAFKCDQCDATFAKRHHMEAHSYSHTDARPCACDFPGCTKTYKNKRALYMHKLMHDPNPKPKPKNKNIMCSLCGSLMATKSQLRKHERHVHFDIKPFKCPHCGLRFGSLSKQKKHVATIHFNMRPWMCDTCGKAYKNKFELTCHKYTHTGEKPYKCDRCEYRCSRRDYLRRHKMTHTGLKPHECTVCGRHFTQRHSMISHMKKEHGCYQALPTGGRRKDATPALTLEANEIAPSNKETLAIEQKTEIPANTSNFFNVHATPAAAVCNDQFNDHRMQNFYQQL